jgi:hypothetical protein
MLDIIAETFPHLVATLRRRGMSRADAAGLILAARYGARATVWSASDCGKARALIASAFINRAARLRVAGGR